MYRSWKLHLAACVLLAASARAEAPASEPTSDLETATFSMYCYWTGEATLGRVDGVVASRIGHWDAEIVQVDYDPERTNLVELVRALERQRSFYSVLVTDADSRDAARGLGLEKVALRDGQPHFIEPKHSLRTRHPEMAGLDLSEQQAIALNSWSYFGGKMPDVLDDEQKRQLSAGRSGSN